MSLLVFLPLKLVRSLGFIISPLISLLDRKHWQRGVDNVKSALKVDEKTAKSIVRKVYINLLVNIIELYRFMIVPSKILKKVQIENPEMGRGQKIFFSAHLSNWELMVFAHAILQKEPLAIVGKEIKNPYFNKLIKYLRRKGNVEMIGIKEGRKMIDLLRKGYSVGFLIDQFPVGKSSCSVKFFGIETKCITAPARLSELYNIPMQAGFIERKNGKYIIKYSPLIPPELPLHKKMEMATYMIENEIKKRPEEWLWLHKRWR